MTVKDGDIPWKKIKNHRPSFAVVICFNLLPKKNPPNFCTLHHHPNLRLKHHDGHTSMADDVLQRFRKSNWVFRLGILDMVHFKMIVSKKTSPCSLIGFTSWNIVKHIYFLDVRSVTKPDPNKIFGPENRCINTKWPVLPLFFVVLVTAWIIRKTNHVAWTLRVGMQEFVPFWGCVVCRSCHVP